MALHVPPSARLRYRLMGSMDADLLFELDQDPEVMRFLNDGQPTPREDIDNLFMPRILAFTNPARGHGLWEVALANTGEYLGWILVRDYGFGTDYHAHDNVELGWRLKRHCWGQGIASEAARAVLECLKPDPAVRRFCAIADPDNLGSIGVMKNLGMQFVDHRVHKTPKRDFHCAYYEMPNNHVYSN
jgi:RimJ/RimL family protein N-acetyltransferase